MGEPSAGVEAPPPLDLSPGVAALWTGPHARGPQPLWLKTPTAPPSAPVNLPAASAAAPGPANVCIVSYCVLHMCVMDMTIVSVLVSVCGHASSSQTSRRLRRRVADAGPAGGARWPCARRRRRRRLPGSPPSPAPSGRPLRPLAFCLTLLESEASTPHETPSFTRSPEAIRNLVEDPQGRPLLGDSLRGRGQRVCWGGDGRSPVVDSFFCLSD